MARPDPYKTGQCRRQHRALYHCPHHGVTEKNTVRVCLFYTLDCIEQNLTGRRRTNIATYNNPTLRQYTTPLNSRKNIGDLARFN